MPLIKNNQFGKPVGYLIGVDLNNNGIIDVTDPLYLDMDYEGDDGLLDAHDISAYDIRLTYVPVVDGPFGDRGDIGEPWSLVMPNDDDDGWVMNPDSLKMAYGPFLGDYLMIFDADCSGTWTCPDKIYLQQPHKGKIGEFFDYYVTVGDFRMYMPAECANGGDGGVGGDDGDDGCGCDTGSESGASAEAGFSPMNYDINSNGTIEKAEVFGAINDYFADEITKDDVFEVITAYFSS